MIWLPCLCLIVYLSYPLYLVYIADQKTMDSSIRRMVYFAVLSPVVLIFGVWVSQHLTIGWK
jgi:hypothetical protein